MSHHNFFIFIKVTPFTAFTIVNGPEKTRNTGPSRSTNKVAEEIMGEKRTIHQDQAAPRVVQAEGAGPDGINESDTSPDQPGKKIRITAVLLAVVVLGCAVFFGSYFVTASPVAPAPGTGYTITAGANASIPAIYFYGEGCHHCESIKPFIADLEARYPELSIESWRVTGIQRTISDSGR